MRLSRWWRGLATGVRVLIWSGGFVVMFLVAWMVAGAFFPAFLLILILLSALGLFHGLTWWVHRLESHKGRELEAGLLRGVTSEGAGLDESAEEADVRKRLEARWQQVYESLSERGYDYYSFPWYLIIGSAQSGKTTSIQKSDQEFPIGDKPVTDYGGTRGCNWFFTNQAILIDTAGRYVEHLASQDGGSAMLSRDEEEWNTFLDLLRRMRSRSPINGVVLTIKLEDILEDDPEERARLVEMLRKALVDIEERLQVRVPVYVLITMCDKLNGFVDFFRHLPGLSNRSLFGWSKPGDFEEAFDPNQFLTGFGGLSSHLERLGVEFMEVDAAKSTGSADDVARMDRLVAFPHEFSTLGPRIATLIEEVFAPTAFNEHHYCRGIYFTSGVQEGSSVVAAARGLVADRLSSFERDDLEEITEESKSYFIADLYQEKIFNEAGLVRHTRRAGTDQKRKRWLYRGAAAIILVAFTSWVIQDLVARSGKASAPLSALKRVTELESTSIQDLSEGSELLADFENLGNAIGTFDELLEDASATSRPGVEESRGNVVEAYRKAYTNKILEPLFEYVLEGLNKSEQFLHWKEAHQWGKFLGKFHSLGYQDDQQSLGGEPYEWDVESFTNFLGEIAAHDTALGGSNVDYTTVKALAQWLQDEPGALDRVEDLVRNKFARKIRGILENRYLGYWEQYTYDSAETLVVDAAKRKTSLLESARAWWAIRRLDAQLRTSVTDLQKVLEQSKLLNVRSLSAFSTSIENPWTKNYKTNDDSFRKLKSRLSAVLLRISGSASAETAPEFEDTINVRFNRSALVLKAVEDANVDDADALIARRQGVEKKMKALKSLFEFRTLDAYTAWGKPGVNTLAERMNRFVTYTDGSVQKLLDSSTEESKLVRGPHAEIVTRLVKEVTLVGKNAEDSAPQELKSLLGHFQSEAVGTALTNRAVTVFFTEVKKLASGDDPVAAADRLVARGTARFPAVQALELSKAVKSLTQLYDSYLTEQRIWDDAKNVDASLRSFSRKYLEAFARYWERGFVDEIAPIADVQAFVDALQNTSVAQFRKPETDWPVDRLPNFGSLITLAKKQHGAGAIWREMFATLLKKGDDATPLVKRLDEVAKNWAYYAGEGEAKVGDFLTTSLLAPLRAYSETTISDEGDFLKTAKKQRESKANYRKFTSEKLPKVRPIVARINAYTDAVEEALRGRPQSLLIEHWDQLVKRRANPSGSPADTAFAAVIGKFPFSGNVIGEDSVNIADFATALKFLTEDPNLKVLYALTDSETTAEDDEAAFIDRCLKLRNLLAATEVKFGIRSHYQDAEMLPPRVPEAFGEPHAYVPFPMWRFSFRAEGTSAGEPLKLLANSRSEQGAYVWKPGTRVNLNIRPDDDDERWDWRKPLNVMKGLDGPGHPFNVLAFLYGQKQYSGEVGDGLKHVRWVEVPFRQPKGNGDVYGYLILGLDMKGKDGNKLTPPDQLPDLNVLKD